MADNYYILVKRYQGDEVVETKGPYSKRKAEKIDDGMNINMNHEEYYTMIKAKGE